MQFWIQKQGDQLIIRRGDNTINLRLEESKWQDFACEETEGEVKFFLDGKEMVTGGSKE